MKIQVKQLVKIALTITFAFSFTYVSTTVYDKTVNKDDRDKFVFNAIFIEDGVALQDALPEVEFHMPVTSGDSVSATPVTIRHDGNTWVVYPVWSVDKEEEQNGKKD